MMCIIIINGNNITCTVYIKIYTVSCINYNISYKMPTKDE